MISDVALFRGVACAIDLNIVPETISKNLEPLGNGWKLTHVLPLFCTLEVPSLS